MSSNNLVILNNSKIQQSNPALYQFLKNILEGLDNLNSINPLEETTGSWVPNDTSGAGLTLTIVQPSQYVKIGPLVNAWANITYPITANGANAKMGGLPFQSNNMQYNISIGFTTFGDYLTGLVDTAARTVSFYSKAGVALTNANLSGKSIYFCANYRSAS